MSQVIIGLGNKARHGKDSFASAVINYYARQDYLIVKHGLRKSVRRVQSLAFADALYKEVNEALKPNQHGKNIWDYRQIGNSIVDSHAKPYVELPDWVQPDPKAEVSARAPYGKHSKLLQWWGTEYRRAQDANYWVNAWKKAIDPKAEVVLVTDMRFYNEAMAIQNMGGYSVQVNRLNVDGTPFVDPTRDPFHVSETELDNYNFDYRITVKTGDLILLDEWAITLVQYLKALK